MDTLLHTPRLALLRLTDVSYPSSPHVRLFHENWSNLDITAWSLHGPTHSMTESYEWMKEQLGPATDNMFYSVFVKPDTSNSASTGDDDTGLGKHIGSVSLRLQPSGPSLPIPSTSTTTTMRALGYALFPSARGKGYATEAGHALLKAYMAFVSASSSFSGAQEDNDGNERQKGKAYIEAAVDEENPGSVKVLEKLGFKKLGWKQEEEKVWLNGAWREPGYWVYGMFV
ncbi:GNAT domain-containing protein [Alternaria rosae]|uniref:GNAT domain-containing protein n=1 Tax=Alternaria rosae TaxID=1187941 RepID=UPI001E8DFFDB|nr:GNAT domain-containing protein [Alternaria rosae]KAH6878697.1 GNAT domain-containing protein [Alternaria rosae]